MGKETNGYISPGWHLGPNIYLGQRIKAPDLTQTGPLPNGIFSGIFTLNTSCLKTFTTDSHWAHFGALLEAYSMKFSRRGDVVIQGGKTYLPIHPSWVLAVGILGRYSTQKARQERPSSKKLTLGTSFTRGSRLPMPKFDREAMACLGLNVKGHRPQCITFNNAVIGTRSGIKMAELRFRASWIISRTRAWPMDTFHSDLPVSFYMARPAHWKLMTRTTNQTSRLRH